MEGASQVLVLLWAVPIACSAPMHAYLSPLAALALAGIVLVILLLICKLTVALGTISGLIFYANIIAVNQSVFFPFRDINFLLAVLKVFIAWLNLDLGIETCYYDGMDAYTRTWLQFIFPVYIWVLVHVYCNHPLLLQDLGCTNVW